MTLARAHDQLVGRAVGGFVLRERIGEGGFGAVYRATQAALDREAVVKVLHARLHASKAATERFLREAKLASKLDHPYAAHIYEFGAEADGELWIAMELVRGTPLDQILKIQGSIQLERFVPLLDRICEVVHTAHEQGIVHRDLKPANVMVLSRAGRLLPKLLDFGIAKGLAETSADSQRADLGSQQTVQPELAQLDVIDAAIANTVETPRVLNLTQRGAIMGSPHYMAPEQWVDAGQVDARTDLYAIGVLAYECLTGKPPFQATTMTAMAHAHASEEAPPLGPRFPPALDKVFAKVLAKSSSERYKDVLEFVAAFRQAAGISTEAASLPAIDPARRDAAMTGAPRPIAEAVAALDAARNAYQARDAIAQLARTVARYLGLVALACRSRVASTDEAPAIADTLRTLYRRALSDKEWLELARQLTRTWLERRDAYPVPELVDAFHGERAVVAELEQLLALREREAASEDVLVEMLDKAVGSVSRLLGALAFLDAYPLVVTVAGGVAESWMGVRRTQRTTTAVHGKGLAAGVAALLDEAGAPVLVLAPLVQVAAPTPGAPLELFLFDGRDARGAKLVALPTGFEHHDDELWDWFRAQLTGSIDDTEAAPGEERAPYRGLSAFSADDGALFFGREKQIDAFVNRLKLQPLLAVVGPSGAGKSSFVYAGVVPALGWRVVAMRPGPSPLGALVARLEHAGFAAITRQALASDREALGALLRADAVPRGPVLLVVDQLEEMFTLCQDADEKRAFAEALAAAARSPDDAVRVVFTLRDDFLVRTEQVPALRNRIGQGLQLLTVPAAEDLARILVEPARRVGYELEGELAADMVEEVSDQPGALALISFTAAKLWELRDRHFKQLTRAAYKALGGVGGALAHHADVTLDEMLPDERALTREAFRHLVTTQNTRAVLTRGELRQLLGGDAHGDTVIEKLVAARLLVSYENESGGETVEVIHEALLAAWPRLVDWRREDSEGARFREQLRDTAKQWDERGRPRGLLWRGDALAEYSRWRVRHPGPLTDAEAAFADASLTDAARGRRNMRVLVATAFVVLVAVVVGLIVFNAQIAGQRELAEVARTDAETKSHELHDNLQHQYEDQGRRLVLANDPQQALAYLVKAAEVGASGRDHDFLVAQATQGLAGELLEVHGDSPVSIASFSHDGKRLAVAGVDHHTRVYDAGTGKLQFTLSHDTDLVVAVFAPNDATLLSASADGIAMIVDSATGQILRQKKHDGPMLCASYSPDGATALVASKEAVVWSVADGSERFRIPGSSYVLSCAFTRDGSTFVLGAVDGSARLYDAHTGKLRREVHGQRDVYKLAISPDGTRLVTGSNDGTAIEWNLADGAKLHTFAHGGAVTDVEFSPDGGRVLTSSRDATAAVWDASTGKRQLVLAGHTAAVTDARFSPDGTYIITTSEDASAWLWNARGGFVVARWRGHEDGIYSAAFDTTGQRVVTAGDDGTAIVWKVEPQARVTWLTGHDGEINDAQYSPDGKRVVTASQDAARIWDASTGAELAALPSQGARFTAATFSPDGTKIATRASDGVRIWDADTARPLSTLTTTEPGRWASLAWSPDGSTLVESTSNGWIRCWNAATGMLRFQNRGHGEFPIYSASFDPTGTRIITTGDDLTARVWDLSGKQIAPFRHADGAASAFYDRTGKRVLSVISRQRAKIWNAETGATEVELVGHVGRVTDARWSPDGAWVLTGSTDRTARIWDAKTGELLAILPFPDAVSTASFAPDGQHVVVGSASANAALYSLPLVPRAARDLEQFMRCRVPFEVNGDHIAVRRKRCD